MTIRTQVLIVGGSLNGLSSALFLATRGIKCLVVERHPDTTVQYKFRGISPRSMELYRSVGIEDEIRANRTGDQKSAPLARVPNLASAAVTWQEMPWADMSDLSPTSAATCDQDHLEPILRAHAKRRGADIRFHTELVRISEHDTRVRAEIRDVGTSEVQQVEASYLIVADGSAGPVRQALGIERHGPGPLQSWMNVIFEADLEPVLAGRCYTSAFITDINGTFVPREDGNRWLMAVPYRPAQGERAEDFDDARYIDLIRRGAGRADLDVTIVDARAWDAAAFVADSYKKGRAFLVGDTAHVMPPTGGFGGNTGIHDAYNHAWKLDAVLRGVAGSALLDTYERERKPVAEHTLAQALARLQMWFKDPDKTLPPPVPIIDDAAVTFGYRYDDGAIAPEANDEGDESNVFDDPHVPSGRPGTRAAHLIVDRDGTRHSTIDLFAGKWVLLTGTDNDSWMSAVQNLPAATALALQCFSMGPGGNLIDVDNRWNAAYGVSPSGAVLVRPDGFIAWRAPELTANTTETIRDVFERVTFSGSLIAP